MSQNSGRAPGARDGAGGGEERERAGDDLIAGADLERHEREQQRIGARGDADAVAALAVGGDGRLELLDRGPEDEVLARTDLRDRGLDLRLQRLVLRLQIQQRHLHRWRGGEL